jgi:hypothetical protein
MKDTGIIDNYADLNIGKYLDIVALRERDDLSILDRQPKELAILSGLTEAEVLALPLPEYRRLAVAAAFLDRPAPELPRAPKEVRIGDLVLVPTASAEKMTAAQYIDFQTFAEDRDHKAVEMLSCFLIPRGCDYNEGYDVLDVHRAIREELSVAEVLALLAFFFKSWAQSIRATLTYSMRAAKRIKDPAMRKEKMKEIRRLLDLQTAGDGWPTSMV